MAETPVSRTLGEAEARQLSNTTKTPPQWVGITPRWLVQLLPWTPVEAGVYRLNRVIDDKLNIKCSPDDDEARTLDRIRYEEKPREYVLSTCTKTIEVHTRISDLFRSPMDQTKEQLTVAIDRMKEKQEDELINNGNYGLLNSVHESMRVKPRNGAPTPDDMDELLARVWKEPSFFLAHPRAIAAFHDPSACWLDSVFFAHLPSAAWTRSSSLKSPHFPSTSPRNMPARNVSTGRVLSTSSAVAQPRRACPMP